MTKNKSTLISLALTALSFCLLACAPKPGPDKTIGGAVLGAAWGAGAGAIVGNQLPGSNTGAGAAVGAGIGLVGGALEGAAIDLQESSQFELEQDLNSLQVQTMLNRNRLSSMQAKLDRAATSSAQAIIYTVYFGEDETDLKAGSTASLVAIAESLKKDPRAYKIQVNGHSDDSGTPDYTLKVSEARARAVAGYLSARGISNDQIIVSSYGSTRPVAPNASPEGRQMNRRVEIYVGG